MIDTKTKLNLERTCLKKVACKTNGYILASIFLFKYSK